VKERLVCPICNAEIRPDDPVIFQDGKTYHLLCIQPDHGPPAPNGPELHGHSWGVYSVLAEASHAHDTFSRYFA
jgi:hypothetical protein